MSDFLAIDCQGFAGGFTMGMVQAGFALVHKAEQVGGFGVPNCEANRHLLGDQWTVQACPPEQWEAMPAHVVFGNPPCSGFSAMSNKNFRGIDSPVNSCMWALEEYTAKVLPYVAVFESVQQAYTGGLSLMRALRTKLEADTGRGWTLHHVLHNAASVGGAAIRRRYFWVVSRIPFGLEMPEVHRVPCIDDVIGDLEGLGESWEAQPYRRSSSWWLDAQQVRREDGIVDGHVGRNGLNNRRAVELMESIDWLPGETISQVARKHYELHGHLPPMWEPRLQKLLDTDWHMGFHQPHRLRADRMGRVITGGALSHVVHPRENRFITHREAARIMGFPDDWRILPLKGRGGLDATWGKGISTQCGKWIGEWIVRALNGQPGSDPGNLIGDREYVHDSTLAYKAACTER